MARAAGVATSAASRSLTEGAPLAQATRARILGVSERMGYRRNRVAAGLTTGRTWPVALLLGLEADPQPMALAHMVARGLESEGPRPLLHLSAERA